MYTNSSGRLFSFSFAEPFSRRRWSSDSASLPSSSVNLKDCLAFFDSFDSFFFFSFRSLENRILRREA